MKKKIFVVSLGLVFSFVLLETSLIFYQKLNQTAAHSASSPKADVTILTLGNSFTVGVGADPGMSYPEQLEKKLNQNNRKKIQVVNRGINSVNSAQVLKALPTFLEEVHPDLVLVGVGQQNYVNSYLYGDYLKREGLLGWRTQICEKVKAFFFQFHSFKFFNLMIRSSSKQILSENDLAYDEFFFPMWERYHPDLLTEFRSWDEKKTKEELAFIDQVTEGGKKATVSSYLWLGRIYRYALKDEMAAVPFFIQSITKDPTAWYIPSYGELRRLAKATMNPQVKETIENFIASFSKSDPENALRFDADKEADDTIRWIKSDLKEFKRILDKQKISVIFHNYQPGIPPLLLPQSYSRAIREFASESQAHFIDIENNLLAQFQNGLVADEYYAKILGHYEGHLNNKGYGLVADQLTSAIKKFQSKDHQFVNSSD